MVVRCTRRTADMHAHDESIAPVENVPTVDPSLTNLHERMLQNASLTTKDMTLDRSALEERRTFVSSDQRSKLSAQTMSEGLLTGPKKAAAALKVTMQKGVRSATPPLSRRHRADRQCDVKRLNGKCATDTCCFKTKAFNQSMGSQMFLHKCGFAMNHNAPKADDDNACNALKSFMDEHGAPEHLTFNGAQVQRGQWTQFMKTLQKMT